MNNMYLFVFIIIVIIVVIIIIEKYKDNILQNVRELIKKPEEENFIIDNNIKNNNTITRKNIDYKKFNYKENYIKDNIDKTIKGPILICFPDDFNYKLKDTERPNILLKSNKYYIPYECLYIPTEFKFDIEDTSLLNDHKFFSIIL